MASTSQDAFIHLRTLVLNGEYDEADRILAEHRNNYKDLLFCAYIRGYTKVLDYLKYSNLSISEDVIKICRSEIEHAKNPYALRRDAADFDRAIELLEFYKIPIKEVPKPVDIQEFLGWFRESYGFLFQETATGPKGYYHFVPIHVLELDTIHVLELETILIYETEKEIMLIYRDEEDGDEETDYEYAFTYHKTPHDEDCCHTSNYDLFLDNVSGLIRNRIDVDVLISYASRLALSVKMSASIAAPGAGEKE